MNPPTLDAVSKNWTVLLVDDEQPSRLALATLIREVRPDAVLIEAADSQFALQSAEQERLDIAFVDIDMPGQNGIELAEQLMNIDKPPMIVFATASNEHAVRAFELNAIDYVVKPFTLTRIEQALARVEITLSNAAARLAYAQSLRGLSKKSSSNFSKLWAERSNGARVLIGFSEIGWASARDKEVYVRTAREELRVRMTLNDLADSLPDNIFVRVHRSHLVNINLAREVIPWDSHSMTLIMGDTENTEIPVSRKYVKQLKKIAGW